MTSLAGRTLIDTYKDLLQISNSNSGVDATARYIEDGEGTPSILSLSTTSVGIGTTAPDRELHIKSSNGAQIQLESTSSADWSGIDFKGGNGAFAGYLGLEDTTGTFFHDISGNNFEFRDTGSEVVVAPTVTNPGALLKITKDTTSVSCIRNYGNGLQWAKLLQLGSDRARESTATDRADAIHVIASCTQFLSGTGSYISNTNSSSHPDGGAYWAVPAIYRSTGVGGGTFPFDKWGELILQGSSYGSNYNMGVTVATWDGVEGVEPQARARISKDGIQSFSQPFASVKLNDDNSQGGQNKTVGPPGGGAVIESSDLVNIEFETVDVNRGNVWDQTNRRFVAPVAGDYQISFNSNIAVWNMGSSTGLGATTYFAVYITKNGVTWARAYNNKLASDTYEKWTHVSLTYDIPLQANDYVSVAIWCSSGYIWADSDGNYTTASFRLLG